MKFCFLLISALLLTTFSAFAANAQSVYFNYLYTFEPIPYDAPASAGQPFFESPEVGRISISYPDDARKNGVQGTVRATATLGEDGKVRDIKIDHDLPSGVGSAVISGLQTMTFKPAAVNGKPVPIVMHLDYVITLTYPEDDKNVAKPEIVDKPTAEYPGKYLAERIKGNVSVQVLFKADGTLQVGTVNSVMPKEFDQAARAAAAKLKFKPAVHKKSHQPVTQQMTVVYEFKP